MSDGSKRAPNRLSHATFFRLGQWLSCHDDQLLAGQLTLRQWAEAAHKALGFEVGPDQIADACKKLNIRYKTPLSESRRNGMDALRQALEEQQGKVRALEAELACLRKAVAHLYDKLGEKAPPASGLVTVNGSTHVVEREDKR